MKDIKLTIIVDRSAKEVFDFTINPENTPIWVESITKEETNESPTRLGTIYRNQGHDGSWAEFEITAFENDTMFEMRKKDDNHHVRYTFTHIDNGKCELEYYVWVPDGEISERFSEENLQKIIDGLKEVAEVNL